MRKCALAATSLAAVIWADSSWAAVFFADDFDGRAGALSGQVADSGQTWGDFTYFGTYSSFNVGTDYGVDGTEGAGTAGNDFSGNSVSFATVSAGRVRLETDFVTAAPYPISSSTTPLKEFFLLDTVHNTAADIYWQQRDTTIAFEGLGLSDPGQGTNQTPVSNARMHVILDIDLTNKTVQYSWSGVDSSNLPFSGSKNLGSYSVDFAPNNLQIWGRGESGVITTGYDNISFATAPSEWNVDNDGNWTTAGNWIGGVPNAAGDSALFGGVIQQARTVTVDAPVTVGAIEFNNANAYTIEGANTLTLDEAAGALIKVTRGSHVISAPVALQANTTINVAQADDTLTISGQMTAAAGAGLTKLGLGALVVKNVRADSLSIDGYHGFVRVIAGSTPNDPAGTSVVKSLSVGSLSYIDLTNNSAIIDYTAVGTLVDDTRTMLINDTLQSSAADATHKLGYGDNALLGQTTFAGQSVDATSLLIKYTYAGDTNLDGQVDVIDLGNLATAWQTAAPWTGGDSNYDGVVDVIDLGMLATNWQAGVGNPLGPGSLDQALAAFGLPDVSVPEPAAIGLIGLGAVGAIRRRRSSR